MNASSSLPPSTASYASTVSKENIDKQVEVEVEVSHSGASAPNQDRMDDSNAHKYAHVLGLTNKGRERKYAQAWEILTHPRKSNSPAAVALALQDLGVQSMEDLMALERDHLLALSGLLKPAQKGRFRQALLLS